MQTARAARPLIGDRARVVHRARHRDDDAISIGI